MRLILVWLLLGLLAAVLPASAETRVALVIGNSAYASTTPLANPLNDAHDVSAALKQAGFRVIEGVDVGKRDFDRALRTFADELTKADVALFFYAGHGLQVGLQNYLLPVDAKLERERDLEFEAVKLDFVLRQMEIDRDGRLSIVILDACRDNPLSRNLARTMGTRSTALGRGLAAAPAGLGTFIAYSTQPGNVALDGNGRNSPFTTALVRHMSVLGRNLPATMIEVRKDVVAETGGRQVPWDHSAMTGDFQFHPAAAGGANPGMSAPDVAALQDRIRRLEAEARQREAAAAAVRPTVSPPVPAPSPAPAAPAEFQITDGMRIVGLKMGEQPEPAAITCQQACEQKAECIAFQIGGFKYNQGSAVGGQCHLFSRVDLRQLDPNWRSGVRLGAKAPEKAVAVAGVARPLPASLTGTKSRKDNGFELYDGVGVLTGDLIKMSSVDSAAGCQTVCRHTPGCTSVAYSEFFRGKNLACQVYRSVTETIKIQHTTIMVRTD